METSDLQLSLTILLVGMTTVFLILGLVVFVARMVIWVTNHMVQEEQALIKGTTIRAFSKQDIPKEHLLVIEKAISKISGGKAKIVYITKR